MSISDRLDEIERDSVEANEQWDYGRGAFNANNHAPPIDVALANSELMLAAVRAVLDLHSRDEGCGNPNCCDFCEQCLESWPCPTVVAIEAALGVASMIVPEPPSEVENDVYTWRGKYDVVTAPGKSVLIPGNVPRNLKAEEAEKFAINMYAAAQVSKGEK